MLQNYTKFSYIAKKEIDVSQDLQKLYRKSWNSYLIRLNRVRFRLYFLNFTNYGKIQIFS